MGNYPHTHTCYAFEKQTWKWRGGDGQKDIFWLWSALLVRASVTSCSQLIWRVSLREEQVSYMSYCPHTRESERGGQMIAWNAISSVSRGDFGDKMRIQPRKFPLWQLQRLVLHRVVHVNHSWEGKVSLILYRLSDFLFSLLASWCEIIVLFLLLTKNEFYSWAFKLKHDVFLTFSLKNWNASPFWPNNR